jgi:uncharacterized membrane protein
MHCLYCLQAERARIRAEKEREARRKAEEEVAQFCSLRVSFDLS